MLVCTVWYTAVCSYSVFVVFRNVSNEFRAWSYLWSCSSTRTAGLKRELENARLVMLELERKAVLSRHPRLSPRQRRSGQGGWQPADGGWHD